ncbi:hypothetical protein PIB30_034505 [Stylosanthes scabra]|uniref:DUF4283 domain-containing protein n=1 Tax=Stylosanthes scabra TaxID=79078 RepID=A0ABU6YB87_9FABA|nr:hypothetical protein [Stylosanthes scabra]
MKEQGRRELSVENTVRSLALPKEGTRGRVWAFVSGDRRRNFWGNIGDGRPKSQTWLNMKLYVALAKYRRKPDDVTPGMTYGMNTVMKWVPKRVGLPRKDDVLAMNQGKQNKEGAMELSHHNKGIFWSLSRRVWIEIMGMPVCLWCKENFKRIASSWGKVVQFDNRTELSKSYSVTRVLVDCYQWELVNEWVKVSIDERAFTVHVKEVGSEIYSVQAHPNLNESSTQFVSSEEGTSFSTVRETPTGDGKTTELEL